MKTLIISICFFCAALNMHSQNNSELQINKELFLFGFMQDYSRCYYERSLFRKKFIIRVHESDTTSIKKITSLTGLKFKRNKSQKSCRNCQEFFSLKIKNNKWRLKKYYDFTKIEKKSCGTLKTDLHKAWNINDKVWYLKGVFIRNLSKEDNIIRIRQYNSPEKHNLTKMLMQDLKFELIDEKIEEGLTSSYFLSFKKDPNKWEKHFGDL